MSLHKLNLRLREDEEGDIGIGTLIIFIAIVLVAAIAASLILYAAALLQQQAQKGVDEAVAEVSGGLEVINVAGDRNPNGTDSTIVSGYMPASDDVGPSGGTLSNVTAAADGSAPARVVLNWTSAVDYGSGLSEEILYRTDVYDPTNPDSYNEQIARNRLLTLDQLTSAYEIARFTSGFGNVQYIDYTVRDDNTTSYAYAVVGVDNAGNRVLYSPLDSSTSTDGTTHDEDLTPPAGGSTTSTASTDIYSVSVFWVPDSDAGSGVARQYIYRAEGAFTPPTSSIVDGRTILAVSFATLLEELNATASSYIDSPSAVGTYYYFVVAEDRSGNQDYLGPISYAAAVADDMSPTPVTALGVRQSIQCLTLTWENGTDGETVVAQYLIFRTEGMGGLDSVEELRAMTPITSLDADTLSYSDYSGVTGTLYYYTVVAVDIAGNYADPVFPSNMIQMIEIKVRTVPGSDPILFTSLMIEITDGQKDATLGFNTAAFGAIGANAYEYSVEILRDMDGTFASTYSLTSGGLVKIFIDAGEIGLNLHAESEFEIKFIPGIGQPTLEMCSIPYLGTYRYITLV
ncbi:MAG: hypothetical protein MUE55_06510 [Thermoplasmata archaeon]|jgi:archaellin|nr:hypothetical protein [Thermoplasmata archaeon]